MILWCHQWEGGVSETLTTCNCSSLLKQTTASQVEPEELFSDITAPVFSARFTKGLFCSSCAFTLFSSTAFTLRSGTITKLKHRGEK